MNDFPTGKLDSYSNAYGSDFSANCNSTATTSYSSRLFDSTAGNYPKSYPVDDGNGQRPNLPYSHHSATSSSANDDHASIRPPNQIDEHKTNNEQDPSVQKVSSLLPLDCEVR